MAQRGHVPRFGDWNQNDAYTTYFDTARKGKAAGPNMVNPNDPEQMAELHKPAFAVEPQQPKQGQRSKPMEYQQPKPNYGWEEREYQGYSQATPPQSRKNSHRANMEQRNQAGMRRSGGEPGYFPSPSHVNQGSAANSRPGMPGRQKPMTVPKFGDWDASDPNASGYTVIFNKVKEDKKAAAGIHVPQVPPQPTAYAMGAERRGHGGHQNDSFCSKLFPCLRPNVKY